MRSLIPFICLFGLLSSCGSEAPDPGPVASDKAFSWMTAPGVSRTGVTFRNNLTYSDQLNPYTYRNFYNGGGVGVGDFNNDGLADLYFSGNLVPNQLYLNRGNWQFEDVTEQAGVAVPDAWSTGVAVADVNGDGWQDIYVCKAGPPAGEAIAGMTGVRHNELFINQGDGTFVESARAAGLAVVGLSVHAAFFDYDGDGDLDCYLLNNSTRATTGFDLQENLRQIPDPEGGNRLYRNLLTETGQAVFEDVTRASGIYSSNIGFGLGVTVGDVDLDGWPDLFISNDYFERDYLYLNQRDGTFRETLTDHLPEISKGSMGADLADINNDGLADLFVTEMLPADDRRYKTKAVFDGWNRYQLYRDKGYHQQFSRNVLQLNRGNGYFSEVGRLAGVEATDWSWGALLADFDNDGWRDVFVANGTGKDLLDQDYINFNGNPDAVRRMIHQEGKGMTDLIDLIPAEPLANAAFRNRGDLTFEAVATDWGLDQAGFSNGAAYADLDNDGDLDLIVNNVDAVAGLYRNNSARPGRQLRLQATALGNRDAIGARIAALLPNGQPFTAELHPMRGFQSSVDKRIHIPGPVAEVTVHWPFGATEAFSLPGDSTVVELRQGEGRPVGAGNEAGAAPDSLLMIQPLYLSPVAVGGEGVIHSEDPSIDFDRDPLLFLGMNNEGPALAVSDSGPDGSHFVFLGGAAGSSARLLRRGGSGDYQEVAPEVFATGAEAENVAATFFDADGDGDPDLYVANGSNQFGRASANLLDGLYLNLGNGRWERSDQLLPSASQPVASGCVAAHDVDGDGDQDLFVGGRLRPGTYGVPATSYLLLNDGRGRFTPSRSATGLEDLGMVTDATWANVDDDPAPELVVVGEWSPIRYLHFTATGELERVESLEGTAGLWHAVLARDIDGDGRADVVAGNHGLNSRLRTTPERPLRLYINDFDGNGKAEQVLTRTGDDGRDYPLVLRDDLVKQLPGLRKQLQRYGDYAGKSMADLFGGAVLDRSVVHTAEELRSLVVLNPAAGPQIRHLPTEAQLAPVYALATADLNGDGLTDLLVAGNQSVGRPEMGIYAASFGAVLLGRGDGTFTSLEPRHSGVYLAGDVRGIAALPPRKGQHPAYLVARSGGPLLKLQTQTK